MKIINKIIKFKKGKIFKKNYFTILLSIKTQQSTMYFELDTGIQTAKKIYDCFFFKGKA